VFHNGSPWRECKCAGKPSQGRKRSRTCNNPMPLNGGAQCPGPQIQKSADCAACPGTFLRSSAKLWAHRIAASTPVMRVWDWGKTAGSLKAAVEQQRNCQFKWYFAAGIPTWAPPAQSPHCPQPRYSLVAPLTLSIHLLERREQRVFFTPGRMSDWGRCRVARTVVQNTKHCTTQKFRGRFTKKIKREKDR